MWLPLILLASGFYAWTNVLDSLLVKHFDNHPMVLLGTQCVFSIVILCVIALFTDVSTPWSAVFIVTGWLGYIGDLFFFRAADCTDISVVNLAWAILTVFIAVGGFLLFGESWSPHQWIGVLLVLTGVVYLSVTQKHLTLHSLSLLTLIALFYTPFYILQKAAFLQGEAVLPVLFWMLLGRESSGVLFPILLPSVRRRMRALSAKASTAFYVLSPLVVLFFYCALYTSALAYDAGMASLVAVASNVQMFMAMLFAWVLWRLLPRYASRELLTRQSVQIKLVSFTFVFIGLAFLAIVPS